MTLLIVSFDFDFVPLFLSFFYFDINFSFYSNTYLLTFLLILTSIFHCFLLLFSKSLTFLFGLYSSSIHLLFACVFPLLPLYRFPSTPPLSPSRDLRSCSCPLKPLSLPATNFLSLTKILQYRKLGVTVIIYEYQAAKAFPRIFLFNYARTLLAFVDQSQWIKHLLWAYCRKALDCRRALEIRCDSCDPGIARN